MKTTAALLTAALLLTAACSGAQPTADATPVISGPAKATPPASWAKKRAQEGAARLTAQGAGGALLLEAINAQGGLERWYANGPLAFRFNYMPVSGPARNTRQLVDTWSARGPRAVGRACAPLRLGWAGRVGLG